MRFSSKKLKRAREAMGFSWLDFTKAIKPYSNTINKMTVWGWEKKGHKPGSKYLPLICLVLKKDISYFFE